MSFCLCVRVFIFCAFFFMSRAMTFSTNSTNTYNLHLQSHIHFVFDDWTQYVKKNVYFMIAPFIKRAIMVYDSSIQEAKTPIVLIAIHGTWARTSPDFSVDKHKTFEDLKQFTASLSKKHMRPVLLLAFGWSGADKEARRKAAGTALARLINLFECPQDAYKIFILAHSHGGNVAHYASGLVKRPIDKLINIATPRRNQPHYFQQRVRTSYNFYSTSDPVQLAGAVVQEDLFESLFNDVGDRKQPFQPDKRVINIRTKVNGHSPGHVMIKDWLIPALAETIDCIDTQFIVHDDLFCDVCYTQKGWPKITVALNELLYSPDLLVRDLLDCSVASTVFSQIKSELQLSEKNERAYYSQYPEQRAMSDKGNFAHRLYHCVKDVYHLAYKFYYRAKLRVIDFFGLEDDVSNQDSLLKKYSMRL